MSQYEEEYKDLADDPETQKKCDEVVTSAMTRAEELFNDPDFVSKNGWKLESANAELATSVYSKKEAEGKLFALRAEVPCDTETYFMDYWMNFNVVEKWNPGISFSKMAVKMGEDKDMIYYGNKDMFAVKARDFVVCRGYRKLEDGVYLTIGKSIELARIPPKKNYVRGELMVGAGRFTPKEGDPNVTVVDYLLVMDLKGMLPKLVVNMFMAKMMLVDVEHNKKHAAEIAAKK